MQVVTSLFRTKTIILASRILNENLVYRYHRHLYHLYHLYRCHRPDLSPVYLSYVKRPSEIMADLFSK